MLLLFGSVLLRLLGDARDLGDWLSQDDPLLCDCAEETGWGSGC